MRPIITITLVTIALVGGCSAILWMNKQKIEEKSKLDGNLETIPVYVEKLQKTKMGADFEVSGSFLPIHELTLQAEGQGKVVALEIRTGDFVRAGQVMARLDDELLLSQLKLAVAAKEKAQADLNKYEGLLKADAISSQQVEEAKLGLKKAETDVATLKKQLEYTTIKAPVQGTINRRFIEIGSLVMPGTTIAEIVDVSRLKFLANVSESEAANIRTGHQVEVVSTLFPGVIYSGKVTSVGVKADDARRFPVEIEIVNNPEHQLRAGMFGTARFGTGVPRETLLISRNSIVGSIKNPRVYVIEGEIAMMKDIRIGASSDYQVEVIAGLKEGELVVTSGQINLENSARVKIVNQK